MSEQNPEEVNPAPVPTTRADRLRLKLRKPIEEPNDPEDVNVEGGKWYPFE